MRVVVLALLLVAFAWPRLQAVAQYHQLKRRIVVGGARHRDRARAARWRTGIGGLARNSGERELRLRVSRLGGSTSALVIAGIAAARQHRLTVSVMQPLPAEPRPTPGQIRRRRGLYLYRFPSPGRRRGHPWRASVPAAMRSRRIAAAVQLHAWASRGRGRRRGFDARRTWRP
jgi:hypothetical protein